MFRQIVLACALSAAVPLAAAATPFAPGAVLNVGQGTVLVNSGSQFVTAKPGQVLKPGDRVMVMSGGAATVKYSDGHSASLPAGTLVSFDSRGFGGYAASSASAGARATPIGPMYAQVGGGGGNDDNNSSCDRRCAGWIIGGGVVALALIISASGHHHNGQDHSLSAP